MNNLVELMLQLLLVIFIVSLAAVIVTGCLGLVWAMIEDFFT